MMKPSERIAQIRNALTAQVGELDDDNYFKTAVEALTFAKAIEIYLDEQALTTEERTQ